MEKRPRTERARKKTVTILQERPRTVLADRAPVSNQQPPYSPMLRRSSRGKAVRSSSESKRPITAAVLVGRYTQCERVQQVEREATRCPSLEPASSPQRYKSPAWQKHTTPLVPFLVGPGYILSPSKPRVEDAGRSVRSLSPEDGHQRRLQAKAHRQALVSQLQQQISDLNLFLEEERLNHRQTKQRAEEYLKDRLDQLDTQHQEHTREVKARHKEEALKHKSQLNSEFEEYQTNTENHIRKLSKDVEQLQGAFEAYKSCLQDELQEKWNTMEAQLRKQCTEAIETATKEMKEQMAKEKATDRTEAVKQQRRTMEMLRKEHKREMDNMVKLYTKEAATQERLKKSTVELEAAQKELEVVKTRHDDSCDKLASATRTLAEMKVQLMDFEEQFQEKVLEVNDKYRYKIHDLLTQNSQLRSLYNDKCGQVLQEQNSSEMRIRQQVKAARETLESLMECKRKANSAQVSASASKLNHALSSSSSSPAVARPSSAPGTPLESEVAHQNTRTPTYLPDLVEEPPQEKPTTSPEEPDSEQHSQEPSSSLPSSDTRAVSEDSPDASSSS